ncbi:MAG: fatty acid desaturase family protein [Microbacteriaceae bacterium]
MLVANAVANLARNLWTYLTICCGHFADGAEKFTPDTLRGETQPQWYLRQMLGSANFRAGPVMAFMSGNLCYQIEHHLYPDLPSNRYAQIAQRVQALCAKYDLPYTTRPLARQYLLTLRTIVKLALPDQFLTATADDAPKPPPKTDSPGCGTRGRLPDPPRVVLRRIPTPPPARRTAPHPSQGATQHQRQPDAGRRFAGARRRRVARTRSGSLALDLLRRPARRPSHSWRRAFRLAVGPLAGAWDTLGPLAEGRG